MQISKKDMEAAEAFIAPSIEKKLEAIDPSLLCDECTADRGCCACSSGSPRCPPRWGWLGLGPRLGPAAAGGLNAALLLAILAASLMGTYYLWSTDCFDRFVASQMVLSTSSSAFAWFLDPPIKPIVRAYLFNYTNIEDFMYNGSKLHLEEVGPLVYTESIRRVNVAEIGDSVIDFKEIKNYQFRPELSAISPDAQVRVPNLPYASVVFQIKPMSYFMSFPVAVALKTMNPKPFVTVGANDLVWGYDDKVYTSARAAANMSPLPGHRAPPNVRFGLLAARNGSGERLGMHTGAGDLARMGSIVRWNNEPTMKKWSGDCDALEASDGGVFPPLSVRRKERIHVFKAEACRRIDFEFSEVTSVYGMETYRYLIPEDEFHMAKGPKCYCEFNGCLPDGLFDTSPCSYGAPVMVSYPHFWRSDPALLEPFTGLSPDGEKHSMKIDVHSRFGLTLSGVSRLQLNVLVRPHMNHLTEIPDGMVLPIAWFEMSLPPFDEDYTKLLQLGTKAVDILEVVLLYGLPLAAICSVYALLRLYLALRLRTVRPAPIVLPTSVPKTIPA